MLLIEVFFWVELAKVGAVGNGADGLGIDGVGIGMVVEIVVGGRRVEMTGGRILFPAMS